MANDGAEKKEEIAELKGTDKWYNKVLSYLSDRMSAFVAFLFFLFAVGAFYGNFIVTRFPELETYLLIAPLVVGLIAYYNRAFATIAFVFLLLFVFLL